MMIQGNNIELYHLCFVWCLDRVPECLNLLCFAQFIDDVLAPLLHDRMTHCRYDRPPETFSISHTPEAVHFVDVIGEGQAALARANRQLGWCLYVFFFVHSTVGGNKSCKLISVHSFSVFFCL